MRRRRTNIDKPRERRTVIPSFDPEELAREIEGEANRQTSAPPFDPASYARIVDEHVSTAGDRCETPRTMTAVATAAHNLDERDVPASEAGATPTPVMRLPSSFETDDTVRIEDAETVGREMYGCYLASDFPEALVLAERVLQMQPEHALAQVVAERCRDRLKSIGPRFNPSSVLRLKIAELERHSGRIDATSSFVLGHIDGVSDAATVAALTGLPGNEALARLHALLDLGVLEVVGA